MKNIETYRQELHDRFTIDTTHHDIINYLEKSFLDGKLSSIHWLHETSTKCQFKQFDPPDDRLELLAKFYHAAEGHDVVVLRAYPGQHLHLLEAITGYLMVNQMDVEFDFRILSHTLASHYLYLVGGMIDIDWSIWHTTSDLITTTSELGRIIQDEAQKVGFQIGYFNKEVMQVRLLSPGSQSHKKFIKFKSEAGKAFPECFGEPEKETD